MKTENKAKQMVWIAVSEEWQQASVLLGPVLLSRRRYSGPSVHKASAQWGG